LPPLVVNEPESVTALAEMEIAAPLVPAPAPHLQALQLPPALPAPDSVPRMLTEPPKAIVKDEPAGTVNVTPLFKIRFPEPEAVPLAVCGALMMQVVSKVPESQARA